MEKQQTLEPTGTLQSPSIIELSVIGHEFGDLTWLQEGNGLPFEPRRVYFIRDIPSHAFRGGHAHRRVNEVLIPLQGGLTVRLENREGEVAQFELSDPSHGVLLPADWWRDLLDFQEGTLLLVIASDIYDEDEYIRDKAIFLNV